jgi:hypothetical protein
MNRISKQEAESSLFRGQKYRFEGYPEWYNEALALNRPIQLSRFDEQLEQAAYFYEQETTKLNYANTILRLQLTAVQREISELSHLIDEVEDNEHSS